MCILVAMIGVVVATAFHVVNTQTHMDNQSLSLNRFTCARMCDQNHRAIGYRTKIMCSLPYLLRALIRHNCVQSVIKPPQCFEYLTIEKQTTDESKNPKLIGNVFFFKHISTALHGGKIKVFFVFEKLFESH